MAFENLSDKLNNVFKKLRGKGRLSESDVKEAMREVRLALLEADVSYKVVKDFVKSVSERAVGTDVLESLSPAQMVIKIVNEELCALMGGQSQKLNIGSKSPSVVMLVGLQGAGKTTNGAKLAALMRKSQNKRPLLVACDVYRPAAIDQLKTVGKKLDLPVYEEGQGDPVEIAKHAIDHARRHGNDLVFLDTAGRLHIDEALMDELRRIKAETEPAEILLVVDAMTGQDAVNAAAAFDEALGITGVMLTKLDGDARGGDLDKQLRQRLERHDIVQHAEDHDHDRAEQDALHLPVDLRKDQHRKKKRQKNGKPAQPRNRHLVHAPVVLRHVDGADLVGKVFDHRRCQKRHHCRHAHRQQHGNRRIGVHTLHSHQRATKPTFLYTLRSVLFARYAAFSAPSL